MQWLLDECRYSHNISWKSRAPLIYEKFASVSGMVNGGFPAIFSYLSLYLAVFLFFLPIIRD